MSFGNCCFGTGIDLDLSTNMDDVPLPLPFCCHSRCWCFANQLPAPLLPELFVGLVPAKLTPSFFRTMFLRLLCPDPDFFCSCTPSITLKVLLYFPDWPIWLFLLEPSLLPMLPNPGV